ncbi:MAG TPA: hypothetical protein VN025_11490 [Candidatus Dormibacteraeota bacterium]|jgi:hypothetical protein|nr:hypothetical protein [Candidatus Dormibacteraeota bacterium]
MFGGKIRGWVVACVSLLVLLGAGFAFLSYRARHMEEILREKVEQELSERFQSKVELKALHVYVFPRIGVVGESLTLRHHNRTDIPPLIQVERFSFTMGLIGLIRPIKHIDVVHLDKLQITLPPRGDKNKQPALKENQEQTKLKLPKTVVGKIVCHDADIFTTPTKPGKEPLDWEIHNLVLDKVESDKPFGFRGTLTNGKPIGEIATQGQFGPWDADDPGNSPVAGEYTFKDADLGPFPGIAGTLSSAGQFNGPLNELTVKGVTDTPDFSLDKVGRPVALHTEFDATVDGTNGDTLLHPVRATLIRSLILAEGRIVLVPKEGHLIVLDVSTPQGRIEDMLSLAINSEKPLMTGPVKLKAKMTVPPGKAKALEKLILDGSFGVEDAKWSSPELREKLESLSRHAQGKPENEDVGSSVSDLKGSFHLEKGVIEFRSLTFGVEGALIDLAGTYNIRGGDLDFHGHLRLQAKLSQTVTGAKSFFLKAFDPFFAKNGAGTELPITITGTRDKPVFGVSVFHKTFKKEVKTSDAGKKGEAKQ